MKLFYRFRRWRSAITGRFVSKKFARSHTATTVGETVEQEAPSRSHEKEE